MGTDYHMEGALRREDSCSPPQEISEVLRFSHSRAAMTKENFLVDRTTKHQNRLHAKVLPAMGASGSGWANICQ